MHEQWKAALDILPPQYLSRMKELRLRMVMINTAMIMTVKHCTWVVAKSEQVQHQPKQEWSGKWMMVVVNVKSSWNYETRYLSLHKGRLLAPPRLSSATHLRLDKQPIESALLFQRCISYSIIRRNWFAVPHLSRDERYRIWRTWRRSYVNNKIGYNKFRPSSSYLENHY